MKNESYTVKQELPPVVGCGCMVLIFLALSTPGFVIGLVIGLLINLVK